ncbi:bifunctional phosphoglucose/phosphomannose isomerase [Bacteroidota bacterium]
MELKKLIEKHDTQNQFKVLVESYRQIEYAWENKVDIDLSYAKNINNIIVAGMGGSAISADLLKPFLRDELKVPLFVNRDYVLPEFADEKTLVIISSYSGNTEETISCFKEAVKKDCKIIAVSTGGWIKNFAKENGFPCINLKEGFQPRFALGVSFFTLLKILQSVELIPSQDEVVNEITLLWKNKGIEYSGEENIALKHAEELAGFIPLIYSSANFEAIGYRLKCQFNENSKLHAFNNVIPELNHNEIIGWETFQDKELNAKLITIVDNDYHPQILKRFEITRELAQKSGVEIIVLKSNEINIKVRIMDLILLCDWITYYLALFRGCDPSEIDYIHELKQRLA